MKNLVVYYSLDGHTRLIAEAIVGETGADIYELKTIKPSTGKSGFAKFFLGGMRAIRKQKPALLNPLPDVNDYELVFIGTPVWGSRNAPAINTFISKSGLTNKELILFASSTGGDASKCFDQLISHLPDSKILGVLGFKESALENMDDVKAKIKALLTGAGI